MALSGELNDFIPLVENLNPEKRQKYLSLIYYWLGILEKALNGDKNSSHAKRLLRHIWEVRCHPSWWRW